MAVDTLARDDHSITYTLAPGTYYIVVDTYTGNTDLPGEYSLSVNFEPAGTPVDEDPVTDEDSADNTVQTDGDTSTIEESYPIDDGEMQDTELPDGNDGADETVVTDQEVTADDDVSMTDEQGDTTGEYPDLEDTDAGETGCSCSVISI